MHSSVVTHEEQKAHPKVNATRPTRCTLLATASALLLPQELGLIAGLLHGHGGAIRNVIKPIVRSIVQRFSDLILPRIIRNFVMGL